MWLINASNLSLTEFFDDEIPSYNILSHTWDKDEVTFQDMQNGRAESKTGYHKIQQTCALSLQSGDGRTICDWVWVDSCCIDKSSSAHLSEAINSMYEYYRRASTCFVYLVDMEMNQEDATGQALHGCRWFTRSWTLQELIAPKALCFFDRHWCEIGTKNKLLLKLVKITRIDVKALQDAEDLSTFSIAQRMSWAADRNATRQEDIAYSLLGIFNVNMPLLYGEGSKAFIRLQEEIMRQSDDQSLFAWGDLSASDSPSINFPWSYGTGFLATSPADFRHSGKVVSYTTEADHIWTMTNKGIQVAFPTIPIRGGFAFLLNCHLSSDLTKTLAVHSVANSDNAKLHRRRSMGTYDRSVSRKDVHTGQEYFWEKTQRSLRTENDRFAGILIKLHPEYSITAAVPFKLWDPNVKMFRPPSSTSQWFAHLQFDHHRGEQHCFLFVFIIRGEAYLEIIKSKYYGPQDEQTNDTDARVLDIVRGEYDWESTAKAPHRFLEARSTASLSRTHKIKASVEKQQVMGQSMFVVDIVPAKVDPITSGLKRLSLR